MKYPDIIDETIDRALVRDSKMLPPFPTEPSSALTAKLAISIASKGMLSTLGAKLALFGGATLLVGAGLYYSSTNTSTQTSSSIARPVTPTTTTVTAAPMDTSKRIALKPAEITRPTAKAKVSRHVHAPANGAPVASTSAVPKKDSTPIPRVVDPHYQPPLK